MASQDWIYYDMPPKAERTPQAPRASQIPFPGLATIKDSMGDSVEEDQHSKRNWIRDTDSKYVKLAKAGGRKDLFKYREHQPSEGGPVPYPRVDWFDHDEPPPTQREQSKENEQEYKTTLPDWYVHDEYECDIEDFITVPPQRRPIMGFDNLSVWKREDDQQTKSVTFPVIKKHTLKKGQLRSKKSAPQPIRIGKRVNFPKINTGKKSPENIKQLLSMGYQSKWLEEQRTRQKEDDRKKIEMTKQKEQLREEQNKCYTEKNKKKNEVVTQKPLFKLNRFSKVQSKISRLKAK